MAVTLFSPEALCSMHFDQLMRIVEGNGRPRSSLLPAKWLKPDRQAYCPSFPMPSSLTPRSEWCSQAARNSTALFRFVQVHTRCSSFTGIQTDYSAACQKTHACGVVSPWSLVRASYRPCFITHSSTSLDDACNPICALEKLGLSMRMSCHGNSRCLSTERGGLEARARK